MAFAKPTKRKSLQALRRAERERAKRKALKALRHARIRAEQSGTELSDWEGAFLESVEGRLKLYGRAFADPEKGLPAASLSLRQSLKVREISAKAAGKTNRPRLRRS